MADLQKPIVFEVDEKKGFLERLPTELSEAIPDSDILLKYPVVYIHLWQKASRYPSSKYRVYIGETNDIVQRTGEHIAATTDPKAWQRHLVDDKGTPHLFVIGHEHFNKSLTLDIEHRLMQYISSMETVDHVFNSRGNPQSHYYPWQEANDIFLMVWQALRKRNKDFFLSPSTITNSAVFKASPLHKLTPSQEQARTMILDSVERALRNREMGQLVFVEGTSGTGKTVLASSLLYELAHDLQDISEYPISCAMIVNHEENYHLYTDIAKRFLLQKDPEFPVVWKPTKFTHDVSPDKPIDVAFIDEGHLLLTQGKMSFRGESHLVDIMARAKVTILMFDEEQYLSAPQYWEPELVEELRNKAKANGTYILLSNQLRMNCSLSTMSWIDALTKDHLIHKLPKDAQGYEIKVFDSPAKLHEAIRAKAKQEKYALSRVVATYDWPYSNSSRPDNGGLWSVTIGSDYCVPWNYESLHSFTIKQKRALKGLAWAEQPHTIDEVGSTFTIQGFDLAYAGVILGPSVKYEDGKIVFDASKKKSDGFTNNRTLSSGQKVSVSAKLCANELRVLLTRGAYGLYIYAEDEKLREALKAAIL